MALQAESLVLVSSHNYGQPGCWQSQGPRALATMGLQYNCYCF